MREGTAPAVSRADRLPSTTGRITRLAYAQAKNAGIALEPLLKAAHLTRHQIENPLATIKVRDQIKFLNLVADALEDDLLGFHLAQVPDLREIGLLYYVLASSDTLIDALQRGVRYISIVNEGILQKCIDGNSVGVSFHYVGVSRYEDRHQIEFWMTALVRICRQLTGLRLLPNRVRLTHRQARNADYAEFFGDDVEFGAFADDITFSNSIRQSPVVSADPHLNKLLVSYCEEAICHRPKSKGHSSQPSKTLSFPCCRMGKRRPAKLHASSD
jgi:hypothetical protein